MLSGSSMGGWVTRQVITAQVRTDDIINMDDIIDIDDIIDMEDENRFANESSTEQQDETNNLSLEALFKHIFINAKLICLTLMKALYFFSHLYLDWDYYLKETSSLGTSKKICYIRNHGINQFLSIYNKTKDRDKDYLLWGDKIEYMVITYDNESKNAKLSLRTSDILHNLQKEVEETLKNG
ncbi:22235_t:CDS:2, partial [Gigaspora rosea]